MILWALYTMLPNIYKFPLTVLPENESYSGHGDDDTSIYLEKFLSDKTKSL